MKKLFSFALMATALLISGQVKAEDGYTCKIGETSYFSLAEAVDAVIPGSLTTITMTDDDDIKTFNTPTNLTNPTNGAFGIVGGKKIKLELAGHTIDAHAISIKIYDGYLEITGPGTIKGSELTQQKLLYLYGSKEPTAENFSVLKIGKDVNILASGDSKYAYGIMISANGNYAYGTVIDLDCYIETSGSMACPCVYINGTVNAVPGATTAAGVTAAPIDAHVPQIYIRSNANLVCNGQATDADAAAIYAAGYGEWHIDGAEMTAPTGIYAKGGTFEVKDATITATGVYKEPQAFNNGISGGGSAIVFDSNGSYPGNMTLNVSGDSNIKSENGYALEELLTSANVSKTNSVEISGGVFDGGAEGCLRTTEEVRDKIVNNATLTGGIFNEDIINYVNNANKVITYIDNDKGQQEWTLGNIPSDKEWQDDFNTPNSYVQLKNDDPDNQKVTEVTGEKNIEYLAVLGNDKVVVKAGARLNVGEVVLNEDAVLVIEPTAMVVVITKQGIISTSNNQLIIEASAGDYGQLLINPEVTFNTTPRATIEFTTVSYKNSDADYFYERFALPTGFAVDSVKSDAYTYFEKWNPNKNEWTSIGYLNPQKQGQTALDETQMNTPFANYRMFTPAAGVKYKFFGKLQGIKDVNLTVKGHSWVGLGNSYAANMDVKTVLEALRNVFQGDAKNLSLSYQKCVDSVNHLYQWNTVTLDEDDLEDKPIIRPMEVFLIKNDGPTVTLPISYENMVWNLINK
ncbi:MAG: hypothetical protein MJZ64_06140 [Paludibacteraceae bacterium]|nr:hypothetical protein [Paludibacteraceae bacterium]